LAFFFRLGLVLWKLELVFIDPSSLINFIGLCLKLDNTAAGIKHRLQIVNVFYKRLHEEMGPLWLARAFKPYPQTRSFALDTDRAVGMHSRAMSG